MPPPPPQPLSPLIGSGVVSCTVDADPRFHHDALRWYATAHHVAGIAPGDLVVHVAGGAGSDALAYLGERGVRIEPVDPFDPRSPHCNKISGAQHLAGSAPAPGVAVLTDTDVAILEDPRSLPVGESAVASRLVGGPYPPIGVLRDVFAAAGVALPEELPLDRYPGEVTVAGNGNGGLYALPVVLLGRVAGSWASWARWLLERRGLLAEGSVHVDQIAMALAVAADDLTAQRLDLRWNFPSQNPRRMPALDGPPAVLHYHRRVDPSGVLSLTGVAPLDHAITRANDAIALVWRDVFGGPGRAAAPRATPDSGGAAHEAPGPEGPDPLEPPRTRAEMATVLLRASVGGLRHRRDFRDVECFSLQLGYARSGSTLVGSLLNAHPEMVVAHEADILRYVRPGVTRGQLFSILLERDRQFAAIGRQWHGFDYAVPGQSQGGFTKLRVIGDKHAGKATRRLRRDPERLDRLRALVKVPLRVIHVVRDPYDNVASIARNRGIALDEAIEIYGRLGRAVDEVRASLGPAELLDLHYDAFVADPARWLGELCRFVGLEASPGYVQACAGVVEPGGRRSREGVEWTPAARSAVASVIASRPVLSVYADEA